MDLSSYGQGQREVCGGCGRTRHPSIERTRCLGSKDGVPAKVVSDYDPFA